MFWEEDDNRKEFQVNDDVVDLVFSLSCKELPVDHSHALSQALIDAVPEFADANSGCAIHSIHLAGSQNGWERPDPSLGQKLILSKRTKLTLRVPAALEQSIQEKLDGLTLDIDGHPLTIGKAKRKLLSKQSTIFARHIVLEAGEDEDENKFLMRVISHMKNLDVRVKKRSAVRFSISILPMEILRPVASC